MRILHVSDSYLPRLGGIELQVQDLSARQRACGHRVGVLTNTPFDGPPDPDVVRVPRRLTALYLPDGKELSRRFVADQWDVVHAHSSLISPLSWQAVASATAVGVPAVLTQHSMMPSSGPMTQVFRTVYRSAGVPSGTLSAVSTSAAAALRRILPGLPVSVLPNGIDPSLWQRPDGRPNREVADGEALTLVSVMRLAARKRPFALAAILARIADRLPGVPLQAHIVGDGSLAGPLASRIRHSSLRGWVNLSGRLSRPEIRDLLHRADVYLAPATLESFGVAALEARCAGVPVVAMAAGGVRDFIRPGTDGLLVRSDREMADRTAALLGTPGQLVAMQRACAVPPPASWEATVSTALALYADATGPLLAAGGGDPARTVRR